MNTVYIKFYMKSGREIIGEYATEKNDTANIAKELVTGKAQTLMKV